MYCRGEHDKNTEIKLPRHPLSFDVARRTVHEPLLRKICTLLISENVIKGNLLDAGCWIGDNAVFWAANQPNLVYAIDPSDVNLSFIGEMKALNNFENLILMKAALSDKNEILQTHDNLQHASFVYESVYKGNLTEVQAVSLDFLLDTGHIKSLGFLHLDVEGMELKVLQGATKLIDQYKPIIIYEQHLDIDPVPECLELLKQKGYSVYIINEILAGCRSDCRNFLAFPGDTPQDIFEKIKILEEDPLIPCSKV